MCKKWCGLQFFLIAFLVIVSQSMGSDFNQSAQNGFRYGPNLSWRYMMNNALVNGQWLPQGNLNLYYTWLEPLDSLNYGSPLEKTPIYLKMAGSLELSPFYGGYTAGVGLRPFKTNPQISVDFTYESYLYFYSNLEMVTSDVTGTGRIAETWNSEYIVENVRKGDNTALDYSQIFDVGISLEYFFKASSLLGVSVHYTLSDISTDFDGKSYDYKRNIPIFSRDFLFELQLYGRIPIGEHFAALFETNYLQTGYLRKGASVEKESLGYGLIKAGPQFSWKRGFRNLTLELGFWKRKKSRFYDGSVMQEFLIQFEYEGYFSFPFSRSFSE